MSLFEQILSTNLINFIIVVSTLVWIFKKVNLGSLIDKMAQDIKLQVENSANNTQNAIAQYKEIRRSIKDTPKLQEEIIEQANMNAKIIKDKHEKDAVVQKETIDANTSKIISQQEEKMRKLTSDEIYLACVNLAQEEVVGHLDNEMHKKLINTSIEEISSI